MINILEPNLLGNERKYVEECLNENWISSQGKFIPRFEKAVLRGEEGRYAVSTSNGTVALHLALVALGVGPGDEVIVPELTFGATLNAIFHAGATPVLVDVDGGDWNLSRKHLDVALSEKTKAVLPVALFGNPSGIADIVSWANKKGLFVIIDAAEAVGATINGYDIGSFGDAVTYSYFGNKTITTGEGGAVVFNSQEVSERARILRDHGMDPERRYHHKDVGFNYRMTNIQAAIGVAQYERLDCILGIKRRIAESYKERLGEFDVGFQVLRDGMSSSNWIMSVLLDSESMESVEHELISKNIEYRRCFEPMSDQPAFKSSRVGSDLSVARNIYNSVLLLPSHVNLKDEEIEIVATSVSDGLK
jgi:perosamine synthetase